MRVRRGERENQLNKAAAAGEYLANDRRPDSESRPHQVGQVAVNAKCHGHKQVKNGRYQAGFTQLTTGYIFS